MLTFQVDDISCGHCVRAIKDAVRALDTAAAVDVDLGRKLVRVQSTALAAREVREALVRAGYAPSEAAPRETPAAVAKTCCGCATARCECGR